MWGQRRIDRTNQYLKWFYETMDTRRKSIRFLIRAQLKSTFLEQRMLRFSQKASVFHENKAASATKAGLCSRRVCKLNWPACIRPSDTRRSNPTTFLLPNSSDWSPQVPRMNCCWKSENVPSFLLKRVHFLSLLFDVFYTLLWIKYKFMRLQIIAFCFYLHFTQCPNLFFKLGLYICYRFGYFSLMVRQWHRWISRANVRKTEWEAVVAFTSSSWSESDSFWEQKAARSRKEHKYKQQQH